MLTGSVKPWLVCRAVDHRVVPITPELVDDAADAVASGFADNEIWVWMLNGEKRVRRVLPRHYRAMRPPHLRHRRVGLVHYRHLGGAFWYPPGTLDLTLSERFWEIGSMMPRALSSMGRAARFDQLVHDNRPKEPHWYLNVLSVDPAAQRGGVGTALMGPGLAGADRDGLGAYLETQRRSNVPFYRRFGFEETAEVKLPDSPPLWLMWRPPGGHR